MHWMTSFFDQIRIDEYQEGRPYKRIHLKRDGYCLCAYKHNGELNCYTRTPRRVWSGHEWYRKLLYNLPENFWLVGELFVPGGTSHDVTSALAAKPTKVATFEGFYSPHVGSFEEFDERLAQLGIPAVQFTNIPDVIPDGYEGFVYKNTYHPKGPFGWMKKKPSPSIDMRIVSLNIATEGKYARKVGAFVCKTDDGKLRTLVGTMEDHVRNDATDNPNDWIGRVIEVKYQFKTEKGALRHPRFVRVRDDKSTTDRIATDV